MFDFSCALYSLPYYILYRKSIESTVIFIIEDLAENDLLSLLM